MLRDRSGRSFPRTNRAERVALVLALCALVAGSYAALPSTAFATAPTSAGGTATHSAPTPLRSSPTIRTATPPTPATSWITPHVAFRAPGPHPQSWGGATPPGALHPEVPRSASGWWGGNQSFLNRRCAGVWPSSPSGQSEYAGGCYGHDEPGIDPYSNLSGSGGNVTWQVQLPVDRSQTQNQSDLYVAIWFGMTLTDPYAWMDQCFLELQFYPDSSFSFGSGTVQGQWAAAAVAWQIEASTGFENPCYYAPLTVVGQPASYFQMTQGDSINVTMTGWVGDPTGENISIEDTSSGQSADLNLYNSTGHYPLDPAYTTDEWPNSLWWTPGGETPISFAFETGHSANSVIPENNTFGGCSPGAPPPTSWNGAVPCPSYDPGSWANDTLLPWQISAPTFFNSTDRQTATQVGFSQDLGGLAFIDGTNDFGSFDWTCLGHETSAYCSYPWYSYSCSTHAFNFGATDYPTTSDDFGKMLQYKTNFTENAAGLGYYPLTNNSVPSCGATSTVTVGTSGTGNGTVEFLTGSITNSLRAFPGVSAGNYSIFARPSAGSTFDHWALSGAATVASATDPYSTLEVTGTSTVTAVFDPTGTVGGLGSNVTFSSSTPGASFSLTPGLSASGFGYGAQEGTIEVANGTTLPLAPGLYSIAGQPPPGANFTGWAATAGVRLSTPTLPDSILDVAVGGTSTVTATFVTTTATATLLIFSSDPSDVVTFDGTNYTGGTSFASVSVGTYQLNYTGAPGARFSTWGSGGSALMTNFSASTWITLETGTSEVIAYDYAWQSVTLNDSGGHGTIAWNTNGNASATAVTSGTTIVQNVSESGSPAVYGLIAVPNAGWAFSNWSVSNGSVVNISSRTSYSTDAAFNTSGVTAVTITANYVAGGFVNGSLVVYPSGAGSITLGFSTNHLTGGNGTVPNATFDVIQFPNAGYVAKGLTVTNGTVTLLQGSTPVTRPWVPFVWLVTVFGPSSALNATFAPLLHPVTFVAEPPTGSPRATLNGTSLGVGDTVWLPNGTYSLSATLGAGVTFLNWTTSWSDLVVTAPASLTTTVHVTGPGTVYALARVGVPSVLVSTTVAPASAALAPGANASFHVLIGCLGNVTCPAGTTYVWSLSDATVGTLNSTTTASVTFTAGAVYSSTYLFANATLNGTSVLSAAVPISVVPALTGVFVNNGTTASIYAGQSVPLAARLTCTDALPCPGGATFTWNGGSAALGSVSPTSGSSTTYLSLPDVHGTAMVSLLATLNGANATAVSDVAIALPLLTSVTVAPTSVTTKVAADTNFTATPGCTAGLPCPAGT
ncbi:MAG TPA: hypothetical protein VGP88_08570, partial [Thermoplasmata archaeon]|nr:hypothetical protein [Thermoplasmata archaeon]